MISTKDTQGQHRESKGKATGCETKRKAATRRKDGSRGGGTHNKSAKEEEGNQPAWTRAKPNVPKKNSTVVMVHFGVSETMPHPDVQRWGREPSKVEKFDQNKGWKGGERGIALWADQAGNTRRADQRQKKKRGGVGRWRKARR